MKKQTQTSLKDLVVRSGYSKRVADQLAKWYDFEGNCLDVSTRGPLEQGEFSEEAAAYYSLIPEA